MREPADLAVAPRRLGEVEVGEGVGFDAPGSDAETGEELLPDQVRRPAAGLADAGVHARLPEVDGQELGVAVGEVQQPDVAEGRNRVEVGRLGRRAVAVARQHSGRPGDGEHLEELPAAHAHDVDPPMVGKGRWYTLGADPPAGGG